MRSPNRLRERRRLSSLPRMDSAHWRKQKQCRSAAPADAEAFALTRPPPVESADAAAEADPPGAVGQSLRHPGSRAARDRTRAAPFAELVALAAPPAPPLAMPQHWLLSASTRAVSARGGRRRGGGTIRARRSRRRIGRTRRPRSRLKADRRARHSLQRKSRLLRLSRSGALSSLSMWPSRPPPPASPRGMGKREATRHRRPRRQRRRSPWRSSSRSMSCSSPSRWPARPAARLMWAATGAVRACHGHAAATAAGALSASRTSGTVVANSSG